MRSLPEPSRSQELSAGVGRSLAPQVTSRDTRCVPIHKVLSRRWAGVIALTRLNNQLLVVNADLIKLVEQAPDTVITLVTGEKLVVREEVKEVVRRVIEFRRLLLKHLQDGPEIRPRAENAIEAADEQASSRERGGE